MDEQEKLNMCGLFLIKTTDSTGAKEMKFTLEGVTSTGNNPIGDWEIVVRQIKSPIKD
jgi:hypothetical protein